eukprot:scaffold35627_cov31-Tisochrysis_lutea.AAC.1
MVVVVASQQHVVLVGILFASNRHGGLQLLCPPSPHRHLASAISSRSRSVTSTFDVNRTHNAPLLVKREG